MTSTPDSHITIPTQPTEYITNINSLIYQVAVLTHKARDLAIRCAPLFQQYQWKYFNNESQEYVPQAQDLERFILKMIDMLIKDLEEANCNDAFGTRFVESGRFRVEVNWYFHEEVIDARVMFVPFTTEGVE